MNRTHLTRTIALILLLATAAGTSWGQDLPPGIKAWGLTSFSLRFDKKTSLKASQLSAFNTTPQTNLQFVQANLSASRKIGDAWTIEGGYARSWFRQRDEFRTFNRVFAELDFSHRLGALKMKHSVRPEFHFPQLRKWRYRFIYSNKLSLRLKELPLRPTPFIRNQLYYYLDGRTVNYGLAGDEEEFDEEGAEPGDFEDIRPPNGFHRYRLTLGLRLRLSRGFYASLFYIWQREFNAPFLSPGDLNVPSPNSGNIQAPFNNFSVIGFSLSYQLRLY